MWPRALRAAFRARLSDAAMEKGEHYKSDVEKTTAPNCASALEDIPMEEKNHQWSFRFLLILLLATHINLIVSASRHPPTLFDRLRRDRLWSSLNIGRS